jgi:1-acyl-sn-glycerol-3-phosphate acyltransferase
LINSLLRYWRLSYRFVRLILHIFFGLIISIFSQFVLRWLPNYEITRNHLVRRWFYHFIALFSLRIKVIGQPAEQPILIVSNHISWVDILVLGGLTSGSFVAKAEIRRWPIIGFLAATADTVFIERGQRRSFEVVVTNIADFLKRGRSVVIFPEGTTTDGKQVLKFRRRLFKAAIEANVPTQPVAIRYFKADAIHPDIPYIDDDTLWNNLMRLLQEPYVDVEIYFDAPLPATGTEAELAQQCWTQVAARFSV